MVVQAPDLGSLPTSALSPSVISACRKVQEWLEARDYTGYEPYDLLNSPYLEGRWARGKLLGTAIIQSGRRFAGLRIRRWLRVPASKNPKALGLLLAAYCDLHRLGNNSRPQAQYLKSELRRLRSPGESCCSWGYDWDFVSLRGSNLKKFAPNCVATCFCAAALLDVAEVFGDREAAEMAESAGKFILTRLNRSTDSSNGVCFSYTPEDQKLIFNNSVLAGALLARLGVGNRNDEYLDLARRSMHYLVHFQNKNGSWGYGRGRWQKWIDSFHTGYNLCGLLQYQQATGDQCFDSAIWRGYQFYKRAFFDHEGTPRYFHDQLYPIDIHSCSQALITLCAFADWDAEALRLAAKVAEWTVDNMLAPLGFFYYQRHRFWINRTPYLRWSQAWMFRALTRLQFQFSLQSKLISEVISGM